MKFYLQDLSKLKIGILGGGQLGWMMITEGMKYPLTFYVMDNDPDAPACRVAEKFFKQDAFREMINSVDIVTYEFEHVSKEALEYANEEGKLLPTIEAVELKRERWKEREFFKKTGLPVPRFYIAQDREEVLKTVRNEFNYCAVVKESKGYDGKGQFFIRNRKGFEENKELIAKVNDVFVVEEFIDFNYEASIIAVRDSKGTFKAYLPTFNYNEKGILIYNYGPLQDEDVKNEMVEIVMRLCKSLNYVGVMGIEFFVKDDEVIVNEFAPRVHNTGHYTLDAAYVSQFEQHIRAIVGLNIAETTILSYGGMVNILGVSNPPLEVLKYGKLYWYGKKEARKRRKMGHANVVGDSLEKVKKKIDVIINILYPNGLDL